MTQRFDRLVGGEKLHMQSLCAMAHYDFNLAGGCTYEQALLVMRQLNLPRQSIEQQFRRMDGQPSNDPQWQTRPFHPE